MRGRIGTSRVAEELAVDVDVVGSLVALDDDTEVHLQVADHVADHEADPDDAGDRHHVLLADRRGVEVEDEPLLLAAASAVPETGPRLNICAIGGKLLPTGARRPIRPRDRTLLSDRCRHANAVRLGWFGHSPTKSMSCSTAPTSSGRRSAKVFTWLRSWARSPRTARRGPHTCLPSMARRSSARRATRRGRAPWGGCRPTRRRTGDR